MSIISAIFLNNIVLALFGANRWQRDQERPHHSRIPAIVRPDAHARGLDLEQPHRQLDVSGRIHPQRHHHLVLPRTQLGERPQRPDLHLQRRKHADCKQQQQFPRNQRREIEKIFDLSDAPLAPLHGLPYCNHVLLGSPQVTPNLDHQYYGEYQCLAMNVHGKASHSIMLREARPPGPLLQVKFQTITGKDAALKSLTFLLVLIFFVLFVDV